MQLLTDNSRKRPLPVTENKVQNLSIRKWIRNPTSETNSFLKYMKFNLVAKLCMRFDHTCSDKMVEYCQRSFLGILGIYSVILTKRAWFLKGLIILSNLTRTFSCGTNAGNPERARCVHLALLGSQSDHITSSCPLADSSISI